MAAPGDNGISEGHGKGRLQPVERRECYDGSQQGGHRPGIAPFFIARRAEILKIPDRIVTINPESSFFWILFRDVVELANGSLKGLLNRSIGFFIQKYFLNGLFQ